MKNTFSMLATFLLLSTIMVFSSCDKDDDNGNSNVMLIHASADGSGVDFFIDDNKQNSAALTYPNNTGYFDVESGTRNFKVKMAGTNTTVINADISLNKDKHYSIFAIDSVADISAIVVTDDLSTPASGKAHVRFLHLSPDAPAVDVVVASTGSVVFNDVSFKEGTAFVPLDAGIHLLDVRVAGTSTVALSLPVYTFQAGKIYTVFVKGFQSGSGSQSLGAEVIVNK